MIVTGGAGVVYSTYAGSCLLYIGKKSVWLKHEYTAKTGPSETRWVSVARLVRATKMTFTTLAINKVSPKFSSGL